LVECSLLFIMPDSGAAFSFAGQVSFSMMLDTSALRTP